MKYIEALNTYTPQYGERSLFLGGGITGCPDWQARCVEALEKTDLVILNPRRRSFNVNDPKQSDFQIAWEFDHLNKASAIIFWFCAETLCPITLFEYGKWLVKRKPLFVGCHPNYKRKQDVKVQTFLEKSDQIVHTNLHDLIDEVKQWQKSLSH